MINFSGPSSLRMAVFLLGRIVRLELSSAVRRSSRSTVVRLDG